MAHSDNIIRLYIKNLYGIQKMRISCGNRLSAIFREQLIADGKIEAPSTKDIKENPELAKKKNDAVVAKILECLIEDYTVISNQFAFSDDGEDRFISRKKFNKIAPTLQYVKVYDTFILLDSYIKQLTNENRQARRVKDIIVDHPLWLYVKDHPKDFVGIGPMTIAIMISEYDIYKSTYISTMEAYAGIGVAEDGKGMSKRKEHLVLRPYINDQGEPDERLSITYNPFLKKTLLGVVAVNLLRSGTKSEHPEMNSFYRKVFDHKKNQLTQRDAIRAQQDPGFTPRTPMHINNIAKRHMIKQFLCVLYNTWRRIEGLPVSTPYEVDKLGYVHKGPLWRPEFDQAWLDRYNAEQA